MNETKIDWCDVSWNPVTGCRHGCPYCYAARTARRFDAGLEDERALSGGLHVLDKKIKGTPYPYGFEPTFHRYRLNGPARATGGKNIFVGSMADLFGAWVPTDWIRDVLDACLAADQHRYIFLTKNPLRYIQLYELALLPTRDNFWYGSTVTTMRDTAFYASAEKTGLHTFWSMEPLLEPVHMETAEGLPEWVILGAETGNRRGKVKPEREWVEEIADFCARAGIPVFYKNNLRTIYPDLPDSEYPWPMPEEEEA